MSMSLNQYMHPRNVFQTPPDFKDLAVRYPEFRKHVIYDLSGKVRLDFKNHESQRALSGTLLKHYFELDVHLPTDRLVPAVPQRLNYVLWLEDLLRLFPDKDSVVGIDIGTGASCILPLLGHKQCGWSFTATETDPVNLAHATENVKRNNLENHIKVVAVGSLREAHEAIEGDSTAVDFVVCNPPFFGSPEEADAQGRAEEQGRTPPSSDMSGAEEEKVWPTGGEVAFVRDVLLKDSLGLREKVRLYTVMLGKKSSVKQVMAELNEQASQLRFEDRAYAHSVSETSRRDDGDRESGDPGTAPEAEKSAARLHLLRLLVELEKQVKELRQGEAWKAGLKERRKECEDRVERVIGVIREEKGKSKKGQAIMAELQGIVRVEVEKKVTLEAQSGELKRESTARVVPMVEGARKQGVISAGTKELVRTFSEAAQKEKETARLLEPNLVPVEMEGVAE
ncbi:U6 small nuclear RNA (adenine-(43)-N(6))-methyltransferase [Ixodes scapularis]